MRGLEGKSIVVAGGGTSEAGPGNGAATAIRLADEGALVVVGDLSGDAAEATVAIVEQRGGRATAFEFDVADEASVDALVACALEHYSAVDGLHVNAADMSPEILGVDGEHDLLTIPLDVWQRTLDVNLTGFLLAARAVIPHLLERGGGAITNTVSDAIHAGEPVRVGYAATKTALTAVTRHIASRWGATASAATRSRLGSSPATRRSRPRWSRRTAVSPVRRAPAVPTTSPRSRPTCCRTTARG